MQCKLFNKQGDLNSSINSAQYAIDIYRNLSTYEPHSTTYLRDLSYTQGLLSRRLLKLKRYDESLETIQEAIQLRNSIIALDPNHINDEIELIRLQGLLGYYYISMKTHTNDILAHDVFLHAKSRLGQLIESSSSESRLRDIKALQKGIDGNLAIVERRLAQP